MTKYFFAATALPPLVMGSPPDMSFHEVMSLLKTNLSADDWNQVLALRRYYDVENVRAYLRGEPLDEKGSASLLELEESLSGVNGLPAYFNTFFSLFDSDEKRLRNFAYLVAAYFDEERRAATGFLRGYLDFERGWRLTAAALRAKLLGRDLAFELRFENPYDTLVAQLLIQKDSPALDPPEGFEPLKAIFQDHQQDPIALYKSLCEWRFNVIEAMLGVDLFSIERILGYVAQLITVEHWAALDRQKGLRNIELVLKGVS